MTARRCPCKLFNLQFSQIQISWTADIYVAPLSRRRIIQGRRFLQASSIHESGEENAQSEDPSSKSAGLIEESSKTSNSNLPHWAIYTLLASSGALLVVAVTTWILYLLLTRPKKDCNTVTPWCTGLSGPLRKAFVTGQLNLLTDPLQHIAVLVYSKD
jgi:hypothetical protein